MRVSGLLVLCAAALVACDEKEGGKFDVSADSGTWPDARINGPGDRDTGVIPDAQLPDGGSAGPAVEIKNVSPLSDPLAGPPLVGSSLEVICEAKQREGGAAVDLTSVMVQLFDEENEKLDEAPLASQGVDSFKGTVPLTQVPTGPVRIRCVATDLTMPARLSNFAEVKTFYDGGPKVSFENLNEMSIVPLGDPMGKNVTEFELKFKVEPSPLATGDSASAVQNVQLLLREQLVEPKRDGNIYTYPVDFQGLVGTSIIDQLNVTVRATNARAPVAATNTQNLVVRVDSKPPVVAVQYPADLQIVGGRVTARLTITDDLSGVANSRLRVVLGGHKDKPEDEITAEIKPVPGMTGYYTFDFEASKFPGESNIPINIDAFDNVGNLYKHAMTVKFDTVPPWVSLDNKPVRECIDSPKGCSGAFLPLGGVPIDGQRIESDAMFRMLVWERGINVTGNGQVWISEVNNATVALYVQSQQDAISKPLIVDNDGDGFCDALNLKPEARVVRHNMSPLGDQNRGQLPPTEANELQQVPVAPAGYPAIGGSVPPVKCGSDMFYAITQGTPTRPTAVYAKEANAAATCGGVTFNIGIRGWTCVVGAAEDNSGNLGISVPLHVCRDPDPSNPFDCSGGIPSNLTCTDGCTMPAVSTTTMLKSDLGAGILHYK